MTTKPITRTPSTDHSYHEYRGSIHMHTVHSDGTGEIEDLAAAAARAGLSFIILTDHNILLDQSWQGWRHGVLTLIDIEVNDRTLVPERNHCLTLGVRNDVSDFAKDPQALIDAVRAQGGLTFLAHPVDKTSPLIPDTYPWTEWDIEGFSGIELWNYMSEFRPHATSKAKAVVIAFFPHFFTTGPYPEMLAKWDELLQQRPTAAIGGPDAHAQVYHLGFMRRRFLPYEACFRAVTTHILTPEPFTQDFEHDQALVYEALAAGRAWVAYDLVHPSEGFRFVARAGAAVAQMGDRIAATPELRFEVETPASAQIRLVRAGDGVIAETTGRSLQVTTAVPGAYRVEVWKRRWFKPRGWIFSNPIYVSA